MTFIRVYSRLKMRTLDLLLPRPVRDRRALMPGLQDGLGQEPHPRAAAVNCVARIIAQWITLASIGPHQMEDAVGPNITVNLIPSWRARLPRQAHAGREGLRHRHFTAGHNTDR